MKFIFVLLALIISCVFAIGNNISQEWQIFQEKFRKSYKSPLQSRERLYVFQENLKDIEEHNQRFENGEVTWKKGINQFSDWTKNEFSKYVNKYKLDKNPNWPVRRFDNLTDNIPSSIDWRQYGAVSYVKDQGQCGSCWSFSTTGAIEGQYKLVKGSDVVLSEQNLIDCCIPFNGYRGAGCHGGLMAEAFRYVRERGIESESDYPYEGKDGKCHQTDKVYKIDSFDSVYPNEKNLLRAVATVGPISVGIQATDNLQSYSSGIFYDKTCTGHLNHGVLAVGYGLDNGQNYWIVKNSWGESWGEAGYFRLSRKNDKCGIEYAASFPVLVKPVS